MDVYSYDNISGSVLVIGSYTILIGGEVVSNGSTIPELEAYVGKGLRKYLNGVPVIEYVTRNPVTGEFCADAKPLPSAHYDTREGVEYILSTNTGSQIKTTLETKLSEVETNSPAGLGRKFIFPSTQLNVPPIDFSSMQSIEGAVKGSSVARLDATTLVGAGTYGHLKIANDAKSKHGITAQGIIKDMFFWGDQASVTVPGAVIHGYYSDPTVTSGNGHVLDNSSFNDYTGDGIHIDGALDQQCSFRAKAGSNKGWGAFYKDCSDMKHFGMGLGGNLIGALKLDHVATPYFHCFDMWNPNSGYLGEFTVELLGQARAIFDTGTISGRVLVDGRNDQGTTVRYDMTGIVFRSVDFKVDETLKTQYAAPGGSGATYSSQVSLVDVDDVLFDACKWMFNDVTPDSTQIATRPDYAIEITTTVGGGDGPNRKGFVRLANAGGLVHKRGRVGSVAPIVAFTKHYCNVPELIEWIDFVPTEPKLVLDAFMAAGGRRDYLAPGTYNKADYPIAYLWFTSGGTLDDVNTTFVIPAGPYTAPAGMQWVYRVWP